MKMLLKYPLKITRNIISMYVGPLILMEFKNTAHQNDQSSINSVFAIRPGDDHGGDRE